VSGPAPRGPAGPRTVKRHNRALILGHLIEAPLTRAQLAQITGLTRATASSLVDELIAGALLVEHAATRGERGRPANPVALNPDGPVGLGVEINVDYISACIVDLTGAVRRHRSVPVDARTVAPEAGLALAAGLAVDVLAEAAGLGLRAHGAGLALPGIVDAGGLLRRAPNLPEWHDLAVGTRFGALMAEHGLPLVTVENEANLAALAELWFGAGRRHDFVRVSAEIGVGAGVVLGAELFRGVRGYAGELGHVVVDPDGPRCACGNRGCLEPLAGQDALLAATGLTDSDALVARAAAGDRRTLAAIEAAGQALGVALAGVINLIDVPEVVLGGLYARLEPWLRAPIEVELAARVLSRPWAPLTVSASALSADAAVRGAAGAVVQQVLRPTVH
jgi:predicted NBD/HSP70 family sugar kinase